MTDTELEHWSPERSIGGIAEDRLGHRVFAAHVANAILAQPLGEGLTLGIVGPWGCGKSGIINLIANILRGDQPRGDRILAKSKPLVLRFNPWIVGNGHAFLEKLVQIEYAVPLPDDFDLRGWFRTEIDRIVATADGVARQRLSDTRLSAFMSSQGGTLLRTPRDVVRAVNAFRSGWLPVRRQVDVGDYVWVTVIKLKRPKLHEWLREYTQEAAHHELGASVDAQVEYDLVQRLRVMFPERFLRASYWYQQSLKTWLISSSIAFQALVCAIEALMPAPEPGDACPKCGHRHAPGPTHIFAAFVDRFVPDLSEQERKKFYSMRSAISHGGKLLRSDEVGWGVGAQQANESQDIRSLSTIARAVLINWLHTAPPR